MVIHCKASVPDYSYQSIPIMGCCASVKVSPREYSTGTINKNSKLYERSKKGKPKTREHEQDQTSPRKKSIGEKVLTREKEDFTAIDQHALLVYQFLMHMFIVICVHVFH